MTIFGAARRELCARWLRVTPYLCLETLSGRRKMRRCILLVWNEQLPASVTYLLRAFISSLLAVKLRYSDGHLSLTEINCKRPLSAPAFSRDFAACVGMCEDAHTQTAEF